MVRSIVIPHDPARSPRLRHLVSVSEVQEAVNGWLEPIEIPAIGVTVYVNEAARRECHPTNARAMALWWLHTANPVQHPLLLGDVVFTGAGGTEYADLPNDFVRDIFEARQFVIQALPHGERSWRDTLACFENVFDAATWCMLLTHALHPSALFRLHSRVREVTSFDDSFRKSDAPW